MPLFTKPQFNSVWAATGSKLTPDNAKISQGWVVEIPPHEYENWVQCRQDQLLAHVNQVGIPMWDATVEYQAGKSYIQGTTSGTVYRAVTTNTNVNPELDIQGNWAVAFQASEEALLKSQNLADVPDKTLARQNLGIATTEFYDGRYLTKANNLADVPNKASARGNIDVYSRQEVIDLINNAQPAGEIAAFGRNTVPTGWLPCDGSIVNRDTYARLFAAIGTTFGTGNGSTTFGLPDLRGEFIRGWDNGRGVDVNRAFGTRQSSQNLAHSHSGTTTTAGQHIHGALAQYGFDVSGGGSGSTMRADMGDNNPYQGVVRDAASGNHTHNLQISGSGGSESRPRNVALLYCIRT